ncbi:MAG: homoserine O-acetyltransferase [Vampirovibrio sp.]
MSLFTVSATQWAQRLGEEAPEAWVQWQAHRLVTPFQVQFEVPLPLEGGGLLPAFELRVEVYGRLNDLKDNAILVCHALTGDAHVAGRHHLDDKKAGWWDDLVGPDKALNPETHCIICAHVLGGCQGSTGPESLNPETGQPYYTHFPALTMGDMVNAQKHLMEALDIPQWAAVIGASMGGFQALEWGLRFPDAVQKIVMIATGPSYSTQGIAFNAVGRHAICHDPHWHGGRYREAGVSPERGLATARMLAHITYVSENSLDQKFGRALIEETPLAVNRAEASLFQPEFQVESYLDYQGQQFVHRFDANSYLYLSKALDAFDVAERWGQGDLKQALRRLKASCFFIAYDTDWLFPPKETQRMVDVLLQCQHRPASVVLPTPWGHDAFLIDTPVLNQVLRPFLAPSVEEQALEASPSQASELAQAMGREDLIPLLRFVEARDRVLDLGCGRGDFLQLLNLQGGSASCLGIEQNASAVEEALTRGLPALHGDMLHLLQQCPDHAFDVAVLHLALQSVQDPYTVMKEMKRVAQRCVIGFPNFGFFPIRWQLLSRGRMPTSTALPYMWYNTPNIHLFTLKDFTTLCDELGFRQARRVYRLGNQWQHEDQALWGVNWRASHAIYELLPMD